MKKSLLWLLAFVTMPLAAWAVEPPLMGWSSWNTYGFLINDSVIKVQADAMVELGFYDCGYNHVNIDDGFFGGRDADGKLIIHPTRFPNGLRPLVDYIHSKGLKAGIYSDAGCNTCASFWGGDTIGIGVGLYGHDEQDMQLYFNELDFDFIKIDYCGADGGNNADGLDLNVEARYKEIYEAIKSTGRNDVTWNICRWAFPGTWACEIANSWRTTEDIFLGWASVKSIINQSLYLSAYTGGGRYNDMDMLEVGRGLTDEEDKTHFGMWCVMSSPLLIGCDLNDIKGNALSLMQNKELIAVNQDVLGLQAYVVKRDGGGYVLVKDIEVLNGTKRVVAFYNPTDAQLSMSVDFSQLDLGGEVAVRDLFEKKDKGIYEGTLSATVPAHGTRIYKLTAEERLERTIYEAETAWLSCYQEIASNETEGTAIYSEKNICSGGVAVGWLGGRAENDLQWRNVYSKEGGEYTLRISFVSGDNRTMSVSVNGGAPVEVTTNSGNWNRVGTADVIVTLEKGNNTVRLYNESGWMADIDCMQLIAAGKEVVEFYPVIFDKSLGYTHNSRRLNNISLNGSSDGDQTISLPTPLKIYSKVESTAFAAKAGETVTPSFGFSGTWMNGFVYIDRGQDGSFECTLNSDGSIPESSDIMAFSYAEPSLGSGKGYNSNGETVSNANVLNPPAFTIPADLKNGYYMMRYKVDWASIDAAGRAEDGNGIIKNGGAVCDVLLNIHGENSPLTIATANGQLLAADGSALPAEVPFGAALSVKAVPADGYVLDALKVRHGHNFDGEQYLCGVKQYDEALLPAYTLESDVITIPAAYIDGDVYIEALFVKEITSGGEGYALSFDEDATNNGAAAFALTVRGGADEYNFSLDGNKVYENLTAEPLLLRNAKSLTLNIEGGDSAMQYYLYVDFNNDGKFSPLLNDEALPAYSSELVAFTADNAASDAILRFTLPEVMKGGGVYRMRLKADVDDLTPAGSDEIVAQGGRVCDFLLNILSGTPSLELFTVNGSIYGTNNSALPMTVTPLQPLQIVLEGAPGFVADEVVVRHGCNIDGEQYINGNCQWNEEVISVENNSLTIDAAYIDGDVALYANFEKSADGEYHLVFSDEFDAPDGTQPDATWWSRCVRQGATWNRWLSDSEQVVYIEDGKLVTRAIPNPDTEIDDVPMITGGVKSQSAFGFTYGRVECRLLTNPWTGNFPALWMMPEDQSLGWPDCGEIDIFEVIDADERSYHTIHSNWTYDLGYKNNPTSSFNYALLLDRYHTYALEWDATTLTWFVDGKQVGRYTKSTTQNHLDQGQWPFDKHFYLILNQSVGNGSWAANADVTHTYETLFDWVRVYQKEGMSNTLGTVDVVDVAADVAVNVTAVYGGVEVSVNEPTVIAVYDLSGRKAAEAFVNGSHTFTLPGGVYVINDSKIVVK